MIYLNNAATSFPKPCSVVEAMTEAMTRAPQSALRSNMRSDDDQTTALRRQLGTLFHISDWQRIFFANSATDAINRIVGGLNMVEAIPSADSHNSVLRPLMNLKRRAAQGQAFTVRMLNHCSNVTGEIVSSFPAVSGRDEHTLIMLDASQSAGCIPIDVDGWGIDILVFTGHKSLFGPTGTGGYYVRRGVPLRPTQFGGTGRDSHIIVYDDGDWEYEVGTPNFVGLAGLKAGVSFVQQQGVENIFLRLRNEACWLIEELRRIPHVTLYSKGGEWQGPVVSFNIEGLLPSDVGYILQNSYDITIRTGLHCAPRIHQLLHTGRYGTVRASLSHFNTHYEVEALVSAVHDIARGV